MTDTYEIEKHSVHNAVRLVKNQAAELLDLATLIESDKIGTDFDAHRRALQLRNIAIILETVHPMLRAATKRAEVA